MSPTGPMGLIGPGNTTPWLYRFVQPEHVFNNSAAASPRARQ